MGQYIRMALIGATIGSLAGLALPAEWAPATGAVVTAVVAFVVGGRDVRRAFRVQRLGRLGERRAS